MGFAGGKHLQATPISSDQHLMLINTFQCAEEKMVFEYHGKDSNKSKLINPYAIQ